MTLGNPERPVGGLAVRAPEGVELRPLRRSDLADATALARRLRGLPPLDDAAPLAGRLDALLASADVVPFVAMADALAVGLGVLHFRRRLNFTTFEGSIAELYVAEERRGSGIGRALLRALEAEWQLRGSHRIQATAPDGAAAAAGLYAASGWEARMLDFRMRPLAGAARSSASARLRPAAADDFDAVTGLISQFGAHRTPAPERLDAVRRTYALQLADAAAGGGHLVVAEAGEGVVGMYALAWHRPFWTDEVHAWLADLIVDEAERGRGIGRSLLADAMLRSHEVGAAQLDLESGLSREAAHGLYRSSGFGEIGRTWMRFRDGG